MDLINNEMKKNVGHKNKIIKDLQNDLHKLQLFVVTLRVTIQEKNSDLQDALAKANALEEILYDTEENRDTTTKENVTINYVKKLTDKNRQLENDNEDLRIKNQELDRNLKQEKTTVFELKHHCSETESQFLKLRKEYHILTTNNNKKLGEQMLPQEQQDIQVKKLTAKSNPFR
jgi:hypothetical protein